MSANGVLSGHTCCLVNICCEHEHYAQQPRILQVEHTESFFVFLHTSIECCLRSSSAELTKCLRYFYFGVSEIVIGLHQLQLSLFRHQYASGPFFVIPIECNSYAK